MLIVSFVLLRAACGVAWSSGLRRWFKAPDLTGVGSNPPSHEKLLYNLGKDTFHYTGLTIIIIILYWY